jgi:hypothetical protein
MSKQLLHAFQSHVVVVALNDRAFAIIGSSSSVKSVKSSPTGGAHVLELSVAVTPSTDADDSGGDSGDIDIDASAIKDGNDATTQPSTPHQRDIGNEGGGDSFDEKRITTDNNPHEIQAVCCTEIESQIWFAVSRENKTLALYSINVLPDETIMTKMKVYPTITYSLPKRAKCLAFGTVPSSSSSSSASPCHAVITGDLAGDAIAYPIVLSGSSTTSSTSTDSRTPQPTIARRLLLGHTASILTGLTVAPSTATTMTIADGVQKKQQHHQFILTADRDEKIRVSYFPKTHIIHGFLLGHSAFISSMDATTSSVLDYSSSMAGGSTSGNQEDNASQKRLPTLCITGSGDGSVRLWDYQTCKEVGRVPVMMKKCSSTDENNAEDTKMPMTEEEGHEEDENLDDYERETGSEEEEEEDDFDEDFSDDDEILDGQTIAVPISVALSPNGNTAVVVRDGIPAIDIHPIPTTTPLSQPLSLHKKETLDCISQPLAVKCLSDGSVMVLGRSPDYLFHFQCNTGDETAEGNSFHNASSTSPFCIALKDIIGSDHIDMPETTLDRMWNKVNDPDHEKGHDEIDGQGKKNKSGSRDLHWNDARRREVDKLAQQRRKVRRREGRKRKKVEDNAMLKE